MITVVGGVNIDIGGRPAAPLVMRDSNPGRVSVSLGGVGRNIAHNLALMGCEVSLVTAIGDDYNAQLVRDSCDSLGIDISQSFVMPGQSTSIYLYINDEKGNLKVAVNDMSIYENLTPAFIENRLELLNASDLVILDANISEETITFIARNCSAPLAANPVSWAKAPRLIPALGRLHMIAPNRLELEALSGVHIRSDADLWRAADVLLSAGLRWVFVTLEGDGILTCDKSEMRRFKHFECAPVDSNGTSDAFMAGLAAAYVEGASFEECALVGMAAAAYAVESPMAVNGALDRAKVFARAGVTLAARP